MKLERTMMIVSASWLIVALCLAGTYARLNKAEADAEMCWESR